MWPARELDKLGWNSMSSDSVQYSSRATGFTSLTDMIPLNSGVMDSLEVCFKKQRGICSSFHSRLFCWGSLFVRRVPLYHVITSLFVGVILEEKLVPQIEWNVQCDAADILVLNPFSENLENLRARYGLWWRPLTRPPPPVKSSPMN